METVVGTAEIVVQGRNVTVPEHYRQHVAEKLAKLERYDSKIIRVDVELQHEKNPRQGGRCQHVEITCRTRGPVVRGEACAEDFYIALDQAVDKLERRFRHAADRRRIHHGRRNPRSLADVTAEVPDIVLPPNADSPGGADNADNADSSTRAETSDGPGRVVREKEHPGTPMTVDQALFQMELVGHDFYLFSDVDTGRATVVYRRHAYDYGLLRMGSAED